MAAADPWRDILLAEDNPADAELVRVAIHQYGRLPCQVHSVHDGGAALAFPRQEGCYANTPRPQLLLLDIGIPKIDGWEVLQTLRTTPALATLPMVMLTSSMSGWDEERRAVLQPLACVEKPMRWEEYARLVAKIDQLLSARTGTG